MENVSQKDIDWLLNDPLKKPGDPSPAKTSPKRKWSFRGLLSRVFLLLVMIILPFFLLMRLSVYLYLNLQWNGWLALGAGAGATVLLLLIYQVVTFRKLKNKKLLFRFSTISAGALVLGFCIYGLLYLSSVNAKSESIREVYRSLHPILRVAVATTTLADGGLVVTDISREPDDYRAMGLSVNQASLHFPQQDGYVHAIDLRTIGRNEIRNRLLQYSLEAMGFNTLRHTGTADHLHIALTMPN